MFPTHEHAHTERWPQRGRSTTMQAVGFVRRSRIQVDILYSGTSPAGYNACAWTLAARERVCSVQSILGGGACLQSRRRVSVVEVHEGAKRPGMWFIPDSLWESLAVGRVVASARSTDAGRRRRPARWTRLCASNRLRSRSSPPDEDHGRSSLRSRRRPARRQRPSRRPPSVPAARPRPSAPGYSLALHGPPTGNEAGRRATPARPRAPNPSRRDGQRPR